MEARKNSTPKGGYFEIFVKSENSNGEMLLNFTRKLLTKELEVQKKAATIGKL